MRVYLDSKDVIGVLTRGAPVDAPRLVEILTFHNSELVLSWSNVIETVTFREPNIRETRRRLELLEQIPQCYILGLPPLIRTEIRNAFRAFTLNSAAVAIDPFVPTWQRALRDPGPALPADLLINYTTTKQVIDVVFNNPQLRQNENAEHVHYALHRRSSIDASSLSGICAAVFSVCNRFLQRSVAASVRTASGSDRIRAQLERTSSAHLF